MPQDIPVEASETRAFTPASLKEIEGAPSFTLRAVTTREKRAFERLKYEESLQQFTVDQIRAEVLKGLADLYGEGEECTAKTGLLTSFWEAQESHQLLAKDDPDLEFSYDEADRKEAVRLTDEAFQHWAPLRRMGARNGDYAAMLPVLRAAVTVKTWKGLPVVRQVEEGYLTVECANHLHEALWAFEEKHEAEYGLEPGTAWDELSAKCLMRFFLTEEEEKNFASPSPSSTTPAASTARESEPGGASPMSESSPPIPESA